MAAEHGPAIGAYATALLDIPLPWTKMRQVYALLGPGQEVGRRPASTPRAPARSNTRPVNVGLIGRMLERGTEHTTSAGAAGA